MKFGFFDDAAKEYVIETPSTPYPWINYLGTDGFFSLISNTGGGYQFYRDAGLRRLTRFRYNNVPLDAGGRMYYVKESDSIWSPGYLPAMAPLDSYKCRHGLGYTVIESEKDSLASTLTCFIPLDENCEINQLTLKNNSTGQKQIQLYSAIEWCLWNATDDAQNFQRNLNLAEVEAECSVLYHKTEYRERRNHYSFFSVNAPINGFETDRDSFLGRFGTFQAPAAVLSGASANSMACGWSPIASHRIDLILEPGEEKTFIFMIGYIENPKDQKWESKGVINKTLANNLIAKFPDLPAVEKALARLSLYWENLLSCFQIESPDHKLNRMVNIWNQYQCMVTFLLSRSASYFESGTGRGIGFRDSCQDILGFVHLIPKLAKERLLDLAAIQFEDGSTYHQFQSLTKRGNADVGSGFNDDPLWLIAASAAFIRETGDSSILEETVVFNNIPGSGKPLFEHLRRSMQYVSGHRGPHGLPLIGRADWNDCLNLNCFSENPGESFQTCAIQDTSRAESLFIAAMFIKYGREYAELCSRFGSPDEAQSVLADVEQMEKSVLEHGWDGEWFLRAYDAHGNKVGSKYCTEGKIFIEPQGFFAMAGVGLQNGLAQRALASVTEKLISKYGGELLSPCYSEYHTELGEITSYPPGQKENGSIFCHNNSWISIGHTVLGNAEEAYDVYRRICPAYTEESSDVHKTEPYVYSQTIAGHESAHFGEAKNSWLTGTAAWSFVNISQAILGIQPDYDGLRINPCIPASLSQYNICRIFRDAKFMITVRNNKTKHFKMTVDGKDASGNLVVLEPGKMEYRIEIEL
ncbi:MAG: glycosyl transferase [Eubacteriales bacterium]